jgi:hypothetical protein
VRAAEPCAFLKPWLLGPHYRGAWLLLGVALLVGSAVPGSAAESAAAVAGVSAVIRARDALAYPRVPPVIPAPDATPVEAAPQLDAALIKALQSVDFAQREAAVAKLVQIGPPALPVLRELAQSAEPDGAWWARAAIQQIEGSARRPPGAAAQPSRDDLLALIAKGPTSETPGRPARFATQCRRRAG